MLTRVLQCAAALAMLFFFLPAAARTCLADRAIRPVRRGQIPAADAMIVRLKHGIFWRPDIAEGYLLLAQVDTLNGGAEARAMAQKATALDPYDWRGWQALALGDLQVGNTAASRIEMRRAKSLDSGFDAYYFGANLDIVLGDENAFWQDIRTAFQMAPDDRVGDVVLACTDVSRGDHAKLIAALPTNRPETVEAVISYLLQGEEIGAAVAAYGKLHCTPRTQNGCAWAARTLAERILDRAYYGANRQAVEHAADAVRLWNVGLGGAGLTGPRAALGRVTDGWFLSPWMGAGEVGFGWDRSNGQAIEIVPKGSGSTSGNAVQVVFDGGEPDHLNLISTWVVVAPGHRYRAAFESRGESDTPHYIQFEVSSAPSVATATVGAPTGRDWSGNGLEFRAPPGAPTLALTFSYRRPLGSEPFRGRVLLANVRLEDLGP